MEGRRVSTVNKRPSRRRKRKSRKRATNGDIYGGQINKDAGTEDGKFIQGKYSDG